MNQLATYIEKIAPFLWEGRGSVSGDYDHYREIRHPDLPLVLSCRMAGHNRKAVSFRVMLPTEVGGTYHCRNLSAFADENAPKPERAISLYRFESAPERVAREIERHVTKPAEPLVLLALKSVADRHALKHRFTSMAENLAEKHGLRLSQWGGDAMYLSDAGRRFDPEAWSELRIDKTGYSEIRIRNLSEQKLIELVDFLCAGGSDK